MDPSSKPLSDGQIVTKALFRNMLKEELEVIRQEVGDTALSKVVLKKQQP